MTMICIAALGAVPARADQSVWSKWLTTLGHQGYTIVQGAAHEYSQTDCKTDYPIFHTCFGNDFQSPYIYAEPPIGSEYIDPYYKKAGSSITNLGIPVSRTYRLAPDDAMIVIAQLPPQAAYFSYQSYLFTRPTSFYPNGVQRLSPDPARANLFATFNNSINNIAIAQQSGLALGQGTVAFITTGNATLQANLVNSFQAAGGLPNQLFTETSRHRSISSRARPERR